MFDRMTDRGFVEFLAAMWDRRGWETDMQETEPGVFMVTGDRSSGQRGLMLVEPATDATVPGKRLQTVATICERKNVDVGVAATRGAFSEDARRIAEANDLHLLDPEGLEATVEAEDMADLVAEYSDGNDGGDGGSLFDRLPIPSRPSLRPSSPVAIPTRGLGAALVVVAVVAAVLVGVQHTGMAPNVLAGVPALGIGLGGGSGLTVTAASLTDGNASAIDVAWDVRVQSTVVTPDGKQFTAPEGRRFVVVQMNVTNTGNGTAALRPNRLAFASNGTRLAPRRLQGATDQLPAVLPAGTTVSTWTVFTVEDGADSGTLLGLPADGKPPLRFHRDRSLPFQVTAA